jgi:hypothetical protein
MDSERWSRSRSSVRGGAGDKETLILLVAETMEVRVFCQ